MWLPARWADGWGGRGWNLRDQLKTHHRCLKGPLGDGCVWTKPVSLRLTFFYPLFFTEKLPLMTSHFLSNRTVSCSQQTTVATVMASWTWTCSYLWQWNSKIPVGRVIRNNPRSHNSETRAFHLWRLSVETENLPSWTQFGKAATVALLANAVII